MPPPWKDYIYNIRNMSVNEIAGQFVNPWKDYVYNMKDYIYYIMWREFPKYMLKEYISLS